MIKGTISKLFDSLAVMWICLVLKFVVYYYLIDWTIYSLLYILISLAITRGLYESMSKKKWKRKVMLFSVIYLTLSIFMFADVMYFNYYNQTVSIEQLWQVKNVAKVPQSFVATIIPSSIFILLDIPFVIHHFKRKSGDIYIEGKETNNATNNKKFNLSYKFAIILGAFFLAVTNPMKSPILAKMTCDEFFVNHTNDVLVNTVGKLMERDLEHKEVTQLIDENTESNKDVDLKGIAKNKNVIMIQLEAFQNFLIGASYNGVELTPNLNRLIANETLYFDNFYANIGKGNTADAEFSSLNSLYPVIEREAYTLYQDNTFDGLPWKLKDRNYSTFAVHGYEGSFWNRENAYPRQGIDEYYSIEDMDASDIIGLGISDKSMFAQAIDIMKEKSKPFFSFMITLTNHHPYQIDESQWKVPILEEDKDSKFASYLQTAYYTDEAIGEFIEALKTNDLYEDSIIVLYGDHHGLNKDMDDNEIYMGRYLGHDYDYDEMFNVPLIIHIPGSGITRTISTVGGQIDIFPTVANLMDIDVSNNYILGQDLVNAESGFVAFTAYMMEGSFVTDGVMYEISRENIFETGRAWNTETGEELDVQDYREYYEKAIDLKKASTQLLEQNMINVEH